MRRTQILVVGERRHGVRMGVKAIGSALMALIAVAAPAIAGTTVVFRAEGEVLGRYCESCDYVLERVDDRVVVRVNGYSVIGDFGAVLIDGALENGAHRFQLTRTSSTLISADFDLAFFDDDLDPVGAGFHTPDDESGNIPSGARYAMVELAGGLQGEFVYREFRVTP